MNLLIIGNGFDLAHNLPTKYRDFLLFLRGIELTGIYETKGELGTRLSILGMEVHVKDYILRSYEYEENKQDKHTKTVNRSPEVQEIYNCLTKNVWYRYFFYRLNNNARIGHNWIDFESEIREIIEHYDKQTNDIYASLQLINKGENYKIKDFYDFFLKCNSDESSNGSDAKYLKRFTLEDFISKTYLDLKRLIRCLEIYLNHCVENIKVELYSPDIRHLKLDCVLSFNYTHTLAQVYRKHEQVCYHYIHGEAKAASNIDDNNMVLGVNEYWEGSERDTRTNFNLYKKFVQRILKETVTDYKKWLLQMQRENEEIKRNYSTIYNNEPERQHVYIFGHSLDITDKDVLREIMLAPGVHTTIFYRNKQQQADQIANLNKILGQDVLLERIFAHTPSIIFKAQRNMLKDQRALPQLF